MQPINSSFTVGARYIGLVNKVIFEVTDIQMPGQYPTPYGGIYVLDRPLIHFRDVRTGQVYEHDLECAMRLLLKKL